MDAAADVDAEDAAISLDGVTSPLAKEKRKKRPSATPFTSGATPALAGRVATRATLRPSIVVDIKPISSMAPPRRKKKGV